MKALIVAVPKFYLTLNDSIIILLMRMSKRHYDSTCKRASDMWQGGFIYGWTNCIELNYRCSATYRQLDLTLKICELASLSCSKKELQLVNEYCAFIRKLLKTSADISKHNIEVD